MQLVAALLLAQHVFVGGEASRPRVTSHSVPAPCAIAPPFPIFLTEGPVDTELHAPSTGTLRAIMLFADFPDAPATETTAELYARVVPESQQWLEEVSHGRFNLEVTRVDRWLRLPLTSASYGLERPTFDLQRRYAQELVNMVDGEIDFSPYDVILIGSPPGARIPNSPTFLAYRGAGIMASEKEMRWGVTFGNDARVPDWSGRILAHETQHMLGLPDLYRYDTTGFPDFIREAGGWDLMSWLRPAAHDLVWHKQKLGWIDESQVLCATTTTETHLRPNASPEGVKAVVVPLDPKRVLVAELRDEPELCDRGVLVYTVDASIPTGAGPVVVHPSGSGEDATTISRCGPHYDATLDVRPGKIPRYSSGGVTVDVLAVDQTGARIRVTPNRPKRRAVQH